MATIVRRETRKRGFFGWGFLILFIAFNVFMLLWLFSVWGSASRSQNAVAIGTFASAFIVFVWAAGDVVLGLFVLLTRGKKIIVEETA